MAEKKVLTCDDLFLIDEVIDDILKYQGPRKSVFGLDYNFIEKIDANSLEVIRNGNWLTINGKTNEYSFKIQKYNDTLQIEKKYEDLNINLVRFKDENSNYRTNVTSINYRTSKNPLCPSKTEIIKQFGTLLVDSEGNFIREDRFYEVNNSSIANNPTFVPYVKTSEMMAINDGYALSKTSRTFRGIVGSEVKYNKYYIKNFSDGSKELVKCGPISELTYDELLEAYNESKKKEQEAPKVRIKDRIFKRK